MDVNDFFDPEDKERPFDSGTEDTLQYLNWYDMFLSAALEKDGDPEAKREALLKGAEFLNSRAGSTAGREVNADHGIGISLAAEMYGLRGFSFFCLIMAAAQEMDSHYHGVYALMDKEEAGEEALSFALAEKLYSLYADGEELFNMRGARNDLKSCPLFTFFPPKNGSGSLYYTFEANRQFASLLKGDFTPDRDLSLICSFEKGAGSDTIVHKAEYNKLCSILAHAGEQEGPCIIELTGPKGSGKTGLIRHSLDKDVSVLFLSFANYLKCPKDASESLINDIFVRCRLINEVLVITDVDKEKKEELGLLLKLAAAQNELVFLETKEKLPGEVFPECSHYQLTLPLPKASESLAFWKNELNDVETAEEIRPEEFARKYRLYPGTIHSCVQDAKRISEAENRNLISINDLTDAVLSETTTRLDALCDRIPLKFTWDDLVIDPRQKEIMTTLCSRIRYRSLVDEEWGFEEKITYGKGVSMILYGSPGTGKTMAAQVMARDIGMALYRVDLSQLVDKYIGETEKNIGRIFDAASDGNVILFFDEADALFSKRTEVQTSNDKHANTEVAYLLQKIEQHDGVTFLATNRFADFDSAFVRRLTYAVHLERPDAATRLKLYEKILPKQTPREKYLDLKFFADTFELSGSEIKEVLYSAAFIAASENVPLGNPHLVKAIKYQQEKNGKLMSSGDFGEYGGILIN